MAKAEETELSATAQDCHAASQLGRTINRALSDSILTPPAYRLLAYLATGGISAATVLADKLLISKASVTSTVQWLEERGLVKRSPDPRDGRQVRIAMTSSGRTALDNADRQVAERLEEILSLTAADDAANIVAALETLHKALNKDRPIRNQRSCDGRNDSN